MYGVVMLIIYRAVQVRTTTFRSRPTPCRRSFFSFLLWKKSDVPFSLYAPGWSQITSGMKRTSTPCRIVTENDHDCLIRFIRQDRHFFRVRNGNKCKKINIVNYPGSGRAVSIHRNRITFSFWVWTIALPDTKNYVQELAKNWPRNEPLLY